MSVHKVYSEVEDMKDVIDRYTRYTRQMRILKRTGFSPKNTLNDLIYVEHEHEGQEIIIKLLQILGLCAQFVRNRGFQFDPCFSFSHQL